LYIFIDIILFITESFLINLRNNFYLTDIIALNIAYFIEIL